MQFIKQEFKAKAFFIITVIILFISFETAFYETIWPAKLRFFDSFLDVNQYPKLFAINLLLLLTGIYLLLSVSKWKHKLYLLLRNKIIISYFALAIISLISIFWAISNSLAMAAISKIFLWLLFIIFGSLLSYSISNFKIFISKILSSIGLTASIIALMQIVAVFLYKDFDFFHQFTYLINGGFGHRNLFSQVILLSLPFSIYTAFVNKGLWRWLGLVSAIMAIGLIMFLLVRSVWLALFIATLISTIAFVFASSNYIKSVHKYLKFKNIAIVSAVGLLLGLGIFYFAKNDSNKTIQKQFSWVKNNPFGSVKERLILWEASINMIKDKPIKGVGAGNWALNLQKYSKNEVRHQKNNTYFNFQRAHNDYLQITAELGIFGLIAFLLVFAFAILQIIKILKGNNSADKLFATALLFSLISYLVVSFFSFPNERIGSVVILTFVLISIISFDVNSENTNKSKYQRYSTLFIIISIVFSAYTANKISNILKGEINTKKAFEYRARNNHQKVIKNINKAYSSDYRIDLSSTPIKWYSATAYFLLGDIDKAFNDYKQCEIDAPYHKHNLNDLGTCYVLKSQTQKAIKYYKKAIALSPHFDEALVNIAIVKYNQNQIDYSYFFIRECFADNSNAKYKPLLNLILPIITQDIQREFKDDELFYSTISGILLSPEWMLNIHKKSIRTHRTYKEQIIEDIIYINESAGVRVKI